MKKKILFIALACCMAIAASLYFIFFSFEPNEWVTDIPEMGSSSSPRPVDLNQDGVLDVVLGGGGAEFSLTDYGVMALNGQDGSLLWKVETRNQIVGSPVFKDITADGVPDVFIGGRSAEFLAINGQSGKKIWEYQKDIPEMDLLNDTSYLCFFTPQFIPDVDGDGLEDLLTAHGGYIKAPPDQVDRPVGSLKVLSSKNGRLLKEIYMPDGRETYMSPLVHDFAGNGSPSVIFGSGGETINGHLFKIPLEALLREDTSVIEVLAEGKGKGFIASPVLTDIDQDGTKDLIVNSVDGRIICLNGRTHTAIWEFSVGEGYEVYTMPAPGLFTEDDTVPDFYVSLGHGPWPDTDFVLHLLMDGSDGTVIFSDTLGLFQYASPVVYDFDEDGLDDVLLVINDPQTVIRGGDSIRYYANNLVLLASTDRTFHELGNYKLGSNLGSTPLVDDLDQDGWLDIIHCYMSDGKNFYSFQKSKIERRELEIKVDGEISWGRYMGSRYDGVFPAEP